MGANVLAPYPTTRSGVSMTRASVGQSRSATTLYSFGLKASDRRLGAGAGGGAGKDNKFGWFMPVTGGGG